jgi:hypothetical protein
MIAFMVVSLMPPRAALRGPTPIQEMLTQGPGRGQSCAEFLRGMRARRGLYGGMRGRSDDSSKPTACAPLLLFQTEF